MPDKGKRSEEEVARSMVAWLQDLGWDVYQEVQVRQYGHVADIVAVKSPILWILEAKQSLSIQLLEQIEAWSGYANYRSIVLPWVRGSFAYRLLDRFGIGLLRVGWENIEELVKPRLDRAAPFAHKVRKALCEEHKSFAAAGNASNKRFSPFQRTCIRVRNEVEWRPGLTMKELVDSIDTHYESTATARSSLAKWIRGGKVEGVRIEEGRPLRLYPTANESDDGA